MISCCLYHCQSLLHNSYECNFCYSYQPFNTVTLMTTCRDITAICENAIQSWYFLLFSPFIFCDFKFKFKWKLKINKKERNASVFWSSPFFNAYFQSMPNHAAESVPEFSAVLESTSDNYRTHSQQWLGIFMCEGWLLQLAIYNWKANKYTELIKSGDLPINSA